MRKFNPEKELNKIQYGERNKLIGIIVFLLVIIAVGSTYALYQIRHTNKLVFNTVGEFKKRDIYISVLVDGETKPEFPGKDDGYVFDNIICDKPGIEASFNNDTWKLTLTTGTTNKCTVKFITKPYIDNSGANYPDLFQGLIPIRYDNNKIYIADYKEKWYDYNNHEWANAVLIDHNNPEVMEKFYTDGKLNVNTEITTDDILQMYVWIPRYKYQLFNAVAGETSEPQMINIEFENTIETTGEVSCTIANNGKETCVNVENGNWYTHPAFTFGDTQLRGIWVGKFEPSDPTDAIGTNGTLSTITILPNKVSVSYKSVSVSFFSSRNIELENSQIYNLKQLEIDTHMIKNMDWGAVAYLTNSKYGRYKDAETCIDSGCEVWINNVLQNYENISTGTVTGCVGTSVSSIVEYLEHENAVCPDGRKWNQSGINASTTGNIYGIYDMNGGTTDYVMGVTINENSEEVLYSSSGFNIKTIPDKKYYDLYEYNTDSLDEKKGHLGDATRETLSIIQNAAGAWNKDYIYMPSGIFSWNSRGYYGSYTTAAGLFGTWGAGGNAGNRHSFRVVLTAQDGVD